MLLTDTLGADLPVKLTAAPDFAANPTFSADGTRLAWIEWDVGHMPWEESRIQIAQFAHEAWAAAAPAALLPLTITRLAKPDVRIPIHNGAWTARSSPTPRMSQAGDRSTLPR